MSADSAGVTVVELFAGIGGLSLGLERAGLVVVGQVEIDPWCRSILARHWPEVPRHDDVRTAVDWWTGRPDRPRVDVVAGGFPCQPVSTAGKRLGTADPRWLWPAMADVIDRLRPRWVLWENVPGLRTRGLDVVHADLVRLGYAHRVGTATACAVGAPHVRRRLFGLAHTTSSRRETGRSDRPGQASEPLRRGAGTRRPWTGEPRPHGVAHGIPAGMDRRRGLGNAVVPHVAEHVGRLLLDAHRDHEAHDTDRRPAA